MSFITIDSADLARVPNFLRAVPQQANRAAKRAVRKVTMSFASLATREIAAAHDVPLRALRKGGQRWSRVHVKDLATTQGPASLLWIGTNPIKAAYLGPLRQTREGASVRGHLFPGGFIATMVSGHRGIFMRRGRARLPIDEQVVELEQAQGIVRRLQLAVPDRLRTVFSQEMNYELNVRGGR